MNRRRPRSKSKEDRRSLQEIEKQLLQLKKQSTRGRILDGVMTPKQLTWKKRMLLNTVGRIKPFGQLKRDMELLELQKEAVRRKRKGASIIPLEDKRILKDDYSSFVDSEGRSSRIDPEIITAPLKKGRVFSNDLYDEDILPAYDDDIARKEQMRNNAIERFKHFKHGRAKIYPTLEDYDEI